MQFEPITLERLANFGEILREYDTLKRHKRLLIEKIGTLKGLIIQKTVFNQEMGIGRPKKNVIQ